MFHSTTVQRIWLTSWALRSANIQEVFKIHKPVETVLWRMQSLIVPGLNIDIPRHYYEPKQHISGSLLRNYFGVGDLPMSYWFRAQWKRWRMLRNGICKVGSLKVFKPRLHADCVRHLVARRFWAWFPLLALLHRADMLFSVWDYSSFPPQSRKVILMWDCKLFLGVRMTQTWLVMTRPWGTLDSNLELTFKTFTF